MWLHPSALGILPLETCVFACSFWYRRTPYVEGYMGLVCNGNSESDSTIKLISIQGSSCGGLATENMLDKGKDGMDVSYIFTT